MIWRVATSEHFSETYEDVNRWPLHRVFEANLILDQYADLRANGTS